jgi:CII-binding regulator of phage lambda lysogenization HflD
MDSFQKTQLSLAISIVGLLIALLVLYKKNSADREKLAEINRKLEILKKPVNYDSLRIKNWHMPK